MQSIGARLHLLRLSMHWSVEECAYRITIEANHYTAPATWLSWERCSDQQASENGLKAALKPIAALFTVELQWLEAGGAVELGESSSDVIQLPNQRP